MTSEDHASPRMRCPPGHLILGSLVPVWTTCPPWPVSQHVHTHKHACAIRRTVQCAAHACLKCTSSQARRELYEVGKLGKRRENKVTMDYDAVYDYLNSWSSIRCLVLLKQNQERFAQFLAASKPKRPRSRYIFTKDMCRFTAHADIHGTRKMWSRVP